MRKALNERISLTNSGFVGGCSLKKEKGFSLLSRFFSLTENFKDPTGQKEKRSGVGSGFDRRKALLILQFAICNLTFVFCNKPF